MTQDERLDALLALWIERVELHGERPRLAEFCAADADLLPELERLVTAWEAVDATLEARPQAQPSASSHGSSDDSSNGGLPSFPGFRTVERLGAGGSGTVYKLVDLTLGRTVAAKVLRPRNELGATQRDFLREAASLALFRDPRIVTIHEFRQDSDPPVLIMEHVEGFALATVAPSLELSQRVRLVAETCAGVHVAHSAGVTHRDLKPSNILLDARLGPKILDFGLASADPTQGHGLGSPHYLAPEQLDPTQPIDARTDVHALGVILYELLCGVRPYRGETVQQILDAIQAGSPALPVEVRADVPEPLQAIALKAMAHAPADRYASAAEMEADLRRYLDGRPVLARPAFYGTALARRVQPHLLELREWLRLRLIHPHEAHALEGAYARLEAREDDWIVASRSLSTSQVLLYLGAFLVAGASVLAFWAFRVEESLSPEWALALLGLPTLVLSLLALRLHARHHEAAGVAFALAGALTLPLLLLVLFQRLDLLEGGARVDQLLRDVATNRQLQLALLAAGAWALHRADRTRTAGLAAVFALFAALLGVAAMADVGLAEALREERLDRVGLRLLPVAGILFLAGVAFERRTRPSLALALHVASAVLLVGGLELFAVDGRELRRLGFSFADLTDGSARLVELLDTHAGFVLNGLLVYGIAWLMERSKSDVLHRLSWWLFAACPFLTLEPLFRICAEDEFGRAFDWSFVVASLAFIALSHFHERKSFYYSGLINLGLALFLVTDHEGWFGERNWAAVLCVAGLATLAIGAVSDVLERQRARA